MDWAGTDSNIKNPPMTILRSYMSASEEIDCDILSTKVMARSLGGTIETQKDIFSSSPLNKNKHYFVKSDKTECHNDVLQRYREVNTQLVLQRHIMKSGGGELTMDDSGVSRYISFPEHFCRRDAMNARSEGLVPWEGSRYIISLLASLADKLLMKYCFLHLKDTARNSKLRIAFVDNIFGQHIYSIMRVAFSALKLEYVCSLHERLSQAKSIAFWGKTRLHTAVCQWKRRMESCHKYASLQDLVCQWGEVRGLRGALCAFLSRTSRARRILRRIQRNLLTWRQHVAAQLKSLSRESFLIGHRNNYICGNRKQNFFASSSRSRNIEDDNCQLSTALAIAEVGVHRVANMVLLRYLH